MLRGDGRGRGRGHRQRQQARAELERRSSLAEFLIGEWAFGLLTATMVQRIAALAVADHTVDGNSTSPSHLDELAALGTAGANPQNCHRELQAKTGRRVGTPNPLRFVLELLSLKRHEGNRIKVGVQHGMVAPHEFFAYLYRQHPAAFIKRFLGGVADTMAGAGAALQGFWRQVPDDDPKNIHLKKELLATRGDLVDEDDLWSRAVPISLHGPDPT